MQRFIHGGGWRSPTTSSTAFAPTATHLLESSYLPRIAGLASINYRLSPYPTHSELPSSADDPSRNVHHPTHAQDVVDALALLQKTYGFGENYVLVGHSAGATLAWQALLTSLRRPLVDDGTVSSPPISMPLALVTVAGIYDLTRLCDHHIDVAGYYEMIFNAFQEPVTWPSASPRVWLTTFPGQLNELWPNGRVVIVAHSKEDGLVEAEQALDLMKALEMHDGPVVQSSHDDDDDDDHDDHDPSTVASITGKTGRKYELVWLKGAHDDIWSQGTGLMQAILTAMDRLDE